MNQNYKRFFIRAEKTGSTWSILDSRTDQPVEVGLTFQQAKKMTLHLNRTDAEGKVK